MGLLWSSANLIGDAIGDSIGKVIGEVIGDVVEGHCRACQFIWPSLRFSMLWMSQDSIGLDVSSEHKM